MSGTFGTIDVLGGTVALNEAVTEYPENRNLALLLETKALRNSTKVVSSAAMAQLIQTARAAYDYVILDTPPMSAGSDAEALDDLADGALLVIRQNQATEVLRVQWRLCRRHSRSCLAACSMTAIPRPSPIRAAMATATAAMDTMENTVDDGAYGAARKGSR